MRKHTRVFWGRHGSPHRGLKLINVAQNGTSVMLEGGEAPGGCETHNDIQSWKCGTPLPSLHAAIITILKQLQSATAEDGANCKALRTCSHDTAFPGVW